MSKVPSINKGHININRGLPGALPLDSKIEQVGSLITCAIIVFIAGSAIVWKVSVLAGDGKVLHHRIVILKLAVQ